MSALPPKADIRRRRSISYDCSEKPKSDLFRDLLPLLNSGQIVLPKSERLVTQLCGLERRVGRSGKDSIDHGVNLHDDLANAVAGAAALAASGGGYDSSLSWVGGPSLDEIESREREQISLWRHPIFGSASAEVAEDGAS